MVTGVISASNWRTSRICDEQSAIYQSRYTNLFVYESA